MDKEKKGSNSGGDTDSFLDRADRETDTDIDRITDTLAIDGETHPSKAEVRKEICRLHGKPKHKRKPERKPS